MSAGARARANTAVQLLVRVWMDRVATRKTALLHFAQVERGQGVDGRGREKGAETGGRGMAKGAGAYLSASSDGADGNARDRLTFSSRPALISDVQPCACLRFSSRISRTISSGFRFFLISRCVRFQRSMITAFFSSGQRLNSSQPCAVRDAIM